MSALLLQKPSKTSKPKEHLTHAKDIWNCGKMGILLIYYIKERQLTKGWKLAKMVWILKKSHLSSKIWRVQGT